MIDSETLPKHTTFDVEGLKLFCFVFLGFVKEMLSINGRKDDKVVIRPNDKVTTHSVME